MEKRSPSRVLTLRSWLPNRLVVAILCAISFALGGCRRHHLSTTPTSPIPEVATKWPGVFYQEAVVTKFPEHERLWIYIPDDKRRTHPCIFISASGSHLFDGIKLSDGDRPEHLPYVAAGYAVVAYDVSGVRPPDGDAEKLTAALNLFAKRDVGIANGTAAIDYALRHLKIDPLRLYAVGHSSAGTLALQLAATDPRIRGVIAYAPITDTPNFLGSIVMSETLETSPPNYRAIVHFSPKNIAPSIRCPVLLFSAEDDKTVSAESVRTFSELLTKTNKEAKLVTVPDGGHYDGMIQLGIPAGINWLGRERKKKR